MKARKLLSLLLTLCMVFSLFAGVSVTASAEEATYQISFVFPDPENVSFMMITAINDDEDKAVYVKDEDSITEEPVMAKAGDVVTAGYVSTDGYVPSGVTVTKTASGDKVPVEVLTKEDSMLIWSFTMPGEAVTVTCNVSKLQEVTVTVGNASLPNGGNAVVPLSISGISELNVSELRMRLFWGSNGRYGWTVKKEELTKERTDAGVTVENYNGYAMWYVFKAPEGETLKDGQLLNLYLGGGSANDTLQVSDYSSVVLTDTSGASVAYGLAKKGGTLTCDANRPYTITVNPGEHGTVAPTVGGKTVTGAAMNAEVVFETVTADEGYALSELQYTGEWGGSSGKSTNGKIKMPGDNITVTPVFAVSRKVTVDESKNVHGSVVFDQTGYLPGRYPHATATPEEGYQFSELHYTYTDPATGEVVEKSTIGDTITMPDADVTAWVVCAKPYSIKTSSSAGGTISASETVLAGRQVTVNVAPETNYALASLKYKLNSAEDKPENWVEIPADTTGVTAYWRFIMPEGDITIRAEFLAYPTIEIMPTENGELKLSSTGPVRANQPVSVFAFPSEGYHLAALYYTVDDGKERVSFAEKLVAPATGAVKVYAEFSDDESNAVSIDSAEDLLDYAKAANADPLTTVGAVVKLTADINLSSVEWTGIENFYGVFDGGSHTVTLGGSKGLFGTVKHGVVRNVSLSGTITSDEPYTTAAPLAKNVYNATIKNCINEAEVNGTYASGMVGALEYGAKLIGCHNYGAVNATDCGRNGGASGLVYRAWGHTFYDLPAVEIADCGNYGSIFAHNGHAAGILYDAYATVNISRSRNSGAVTTEVSDLPENADWLGTLAAGILARASTTSACTVTITDCYNTGNIKADSVGVKQDSVPSAAGIVTFNDEAKSMANNKGLVTVTNCYNTGTLTKSGQDADHGDTTTVGKGEIATEEVYTGNNYSGFSKTSIASLGILTKTNCYTSSDTITASSLGGSYKDDANGVNKGSTPLLQWESEEVDDAPRAVTFEVVGPTSYELTVSANADLSDPMTAEADGTYLAVPGTYYYRVAAEGYVIYKGSFSVVRSAPTVRVEMQQGVEVRFALSPANAALVLSDGRNEIEIFEVSSGVYRATLVEGALYNYSVSAEGYNSTQREFTAKAGTVSVSLTASSRPVEVQYIYGDGNEGQTHTVSAGGTYYIGDGATGVLTVSTTDPVTLIGAGTALSSAYEDLYIKCSVAGVKLTLQDVGIHNTRGSGDPKMTNMINFRGTGNELSFAGISVLDQDTGATGYAMIHVPDGAELTVSGGTAYFYKREQGAGIGGNGGAKGGEGQAAETNGTIIIRDAELFFKNTKQGACIGAGANAGTQVPGDIRIENSRLNLIANSRAAAIGGAAGNVGASSGTNVYVDAESTVSINVDWSGSAIGGGGFDAGNDADGGKLIYSGGSIRAFIDFNAIGNWGVESAGIHGNKAVTADVVNAAGDALYLLVLNTSGVGGSEFTVKEGSELIYSGTTHQWAFVNEKLEKQDQVDVKYTIDNWVELVDPNLYLYMTGEDHTLTVNGTEFEAKWDSESESFTVTNLSSGETVTPGKTETDLPFTDVTDHWALDAIRYAYENKLFNGVSDTEFAPNMTMTRGMLVTVLYRLESELETAASADFTDVDAEQWYAKAVAWAAENEIVKGYGSTFGPNDLVTREQMATILLRYATWKQYDTTADKSLSDYADYAEISGWATAALEWANAEGLILGRTETTIVPQGDATRAEVATILMRFIEKFAK